MKLSRPGGKWQTHTLVVCPKMSDPMLLSWATQKSLGILPMNWPLHDYSRKGGVDLDHLDITNSGRVRKINMAKA